MSNMHVGIVGLRPRQIDDVRRREISGLSIHFYEQKSFDSDQLSAFGRKVDKIFVMPHHVPKSVPKLIPADKRVVVTGSVSTLIRQLSTLQKPLQVPAPVASTKIKPAITQLDGETTWRGPLAEHQTVSQAKPVAPVVLQGERPVYAYKDDVVVQPCGPGGIQNYRILGAVQLGDIIRFERPRKVNARVWKTRIANARSYYLKKLGIVFEPHFFKDMVDLLATDVPARTNFMESEDIRKEMSEYGIEQIRKDLLALKPSTGSDQGTTADADTADAESATVVDEAVKPAYDALQRSFWKRAYLACLTFGNTPIEAAGKADAALRAYTERFS